VKATSLLRGPVAVAPSGGDPAAAAAADPTWPHRVVGGGLDKQDVAGVAVGEAHTVALTSGGQLWAWGSNAQGQLGRLECAERSHHPMGRRRPGGGVNDTKSVFGGFVKGNGTGCEVYGAPAAGRQETPAPLELSLRWRPYRPEARERNRLLDADLEPVRFRQVAAAGHYTVAVSAPPQPSTPKAAAAEATTAKLADKPPSNVVTSAAEMGSDVFTTVAATMGGQVYTFGYGDTGQLGHGVGFQPGVMDSYRALVPTPVAALEGVDVVQVSAGKHHVAAVTRDGIVYTWQGRDCLHVAFTHFF
jgi:hypothetical protein